MYLSGRCCQAPAVRHVYKHETPRLKSVARLRQVPAAFARDSKKAAMREAKTRFPSLTEADMKAAYAILVDYAPGSLERIAIPPGGKAPSGVSSSALRQFGYVPKSGVAKGWTVVYRHKATGEFYGYKAMREWYASAYTYKYLAHMGELFAPNDRLSLDKLPASLRKDITKTAMRRGYFTEKEAIRWMRKLLHRIEKENDWAAYDDLLNIWPEIEGVHEKGSP